MAAVGWMLVIFGGLCLIGAALATAMVLVSVEVNVWTDALLAVVGASATVAGAILLAINRRANHRS